MDINVFHETQRSQQFITISGTQVLGGWPLVKLLHLEVKSLQVRDVVE